jgi:hypothetical protein
MNVRCFRCRKHVLWPKFMAMPRGNYADEKFPAHERCGLDFLSDLKHLTSDDAKDQFLDQALKQVSH